MGGLIRPFSLKFNNLTKIMLKKKIILGLLVLVLGLSFVSGCSLTKNKLVLKNSDLAGTWKIEEGSGFDEITLDEDGTYHSFFRLTPFDNGAWKFVDDGLSLKSDSGKTMDKNFKKIDLDKKNNKLILDKDTVWLKTR